MTFQQIRYFLVLAEELHFWKTAEKVYTSQSSLSRQIQALEEELGITLFERDKRNVKLTDAGIFLKKKWGDLLDEFDRTHQHAKKIEEGSSGLVSIAYPGSISYNYLPELLKIFSEEKPDLKVELMEPIDISIENLLTNYQIDLAFSRNKVLNSSVLFEKLYAEPVCLVVPENHWLTADNFVDLKDVKNEKFIISGLHHTTYFSSLLRNIFNTYGFEPQTHIESDFGSMILNLISKGLGISILPYSFQFSLNSKVRFIKLPENTELYINWRKNDNRKITQDVINYSINLGKNYRKKFV
ncbi:LysR family transcriptional regulator [Tenacibaculum caenipelagi]|uniref:LysR family transcriptional regulator n=1 Tax=Tenacibaculum caenipelagi TaxID=1325435 RepID=A0A4R6TAQ9_9FLAO|nr:LysR family transcriptional regulator [Tenacibaculum caenipelagi]TDQ23986.1 LysR family transcriptional regulator [Tenacibaculum caenipelagi]